MKTVILDENQKPINEKSDPKKYYNQFDITEDAITINCAVFQRITEKREQLTTVLLFQNTESAEDIVLDREVNNLGEVCIAKGFFSYAGNKPNKHEWIPKIVPEDPEYQSEVESLQSEIEAKVRKLFKGETDDSQVTLKSNMTDVVASDLNQSSKVDTNVAHVPWLQMTNNTSGSGTREDGGLEAGKEIAIESIFPHPAKPKTIYPKEQPTVVM